MKQTIRILSLLFALLTLTLSFVACGETAPATTAEEPASVTATAPATEEEKESEKIAKEGLWKDALYVEKTTLGQGKTAIDFAVSADGKKVEFVINTDKETLADALVEVGLVEGEDGPYGLYVKKVNGITADYDKDQSWWGLNVNGESSMTGASEVKVKAGDKYEFVYSK